MYPELKEQLKELRKHLVESTNEMAPLKVWQMQGVFSRFPSLHNFTFIIVSVVTLLNKWIQLSMLDACD